MSIDPRLFEKLVIAVQLAEIAAQDMVEAEERAKTMRVSAYRGLGNAQQELEDYIDSCTKDIREP